MISFKPRTVLISEDNLYGSQASALSAYFAALKDADRASQTEEVVIDGCIQDDSDLARILESLCSLSCLQSVSVSNCTMAQHSVDALRKLAPMLREIRLSNISELAKPQVN